MSDLLTYIEKYRVPIIGTLAFHLALLLMLSWFTVEQRTMNRPEPLIVMDFEEPEEQRPEEEREREEQSADRRESRTDRAVSESAPEGAREGARNRFEETPGENARSKIDREIEDKLREIEEEVIREQREAGYGYTEEEAEALINSKRIPEIEKVKEREAESEEAVKGNTNISYRLENRYDRYIYVPVYLCRYGGKVTVNIAIDRSGNVRAAKVDEESSETSDPCLLKAAISAAESTRFNTDQNAPEMQRGNITFRFVPQ